MLPGKLKWLMTALVLATAAAGGCGGNEEVTADLIRRVGPEMRVDGNVNKKQWASAQTINIQTNTFAETKKYQSPTIVKAVYNDEALFLLFVSQDEHIVAKHTQLNSSVSEDDCVEFFAVPQPSKNNDYFNLEINCVGTMLMGFGPEAQSWEDLDSRKGITQEQAKQVEIYHSLPGPTKKAHKSDKQWIIECKIPFSLLKDFAAADRPKSGDLWNVNFYRCGGKVDEVHASWQSVPKGGIGFHQPKFFAPLRFE